MTNYAGRANYLVMLLVLASACFALFGCTAAPPKPTNYTLYGEADATLNRDTANRPLSVVLNVYQLTDRQAFSRQTFDDFVAGKSDADLFGAELIQKSELIVLPGDKKSIAMNLLPETKYVGIVAIYRLPAEQQWRYLVPASEIRKTNFIGMRKDITVSLRLHDCYMEVDGVAIDLIPGQKKGVTPSCSIGTPSALEKKPS